MTKYAKLEQVTAYIMLQFSGRRTWRRNCELIQQQYGQKLWLSRSSNSSWCSIVTFRGLMPWPGSLLTIYRDHTSNNMGEGGHHWRRRAAIWELRKTGWEWQGNTFPYQEECTSIMETTKATRFWPDQITSGILQLWSANRMFSVGFDTSKMKQPYTSTLCTVNINLMLSKA